MTLIGGVRCAVTPKNAASTLPEAPFPIANFSSWASLGVGRSGIPAAGRIYFEIMVRSIMSYVKTAAMAAICLTSSLCATQSFAASIESKTATPNMPAPNIDRVSGSGIDANVVKFTW